MSFDDIRKKLDFEGEHEADSDVAADDDAAAADGGSPPPEVIAAYLRVRPFTAEDSARGYQKRPIEILNKNTVSVGSYPRESRLASRKGIGKSANTAAESGQMVTTFTFSEVFGEACSQQAVFDASILPMVRNFLAGHDSLVFAHGITNSGKTYTMQGNAKEPGMIPRSLSHIFSSLEGKLYTGVDLKPIMFADVTRLSPKEAAAELAAKTAVLSAEKHAHDATLLSQSLQLSSHSQSSLSDCDDTDVTADVASTNSALRPTTKEATKYSVWLSFAEIYKEQMFDLLEPSQGGGKAPPRRKPLKMAEDRHGQPYIRDLRSVCVGSAEEANRLITIGQKNLQYACTRLNESSSRSHCVLTLRLLHVVEFDDDSDESSSDGVDAKFHVSRVNLISFCDLAGSERTNRTDNVGERLKEASNINASLFTLGRCITAMRDLAAQQQQHRARVVGSIVVPFRASKLTRLFQNFFCGKGKVCMFVNVSQCSGDYDENIHALKFSALAQKAAFVPVVPEFKVPPPKRQKSSRPLSLATNYSLDSRNSIAWATPGTIRALGEVGQRVSSLMPQEVLEVREPDAQGRRQQQSAAADDLAPQESKSDGEGADVQHTEAKPNAESSSTVEDQAGDESDDETYDSVVNFYAQREKQFRKAIEELTAALIAAREDLKEAKLAAEAREKCVRAEVCAAWKADVERLEEEYRARLEKEREGEQQLMNQKVELIEDFVHKSAIKRGHWQLRRTSASDSSDDEEANSSSAGGSPRPKLLKFAENKENRSCVSGREAAEKPVHQKPIPEEPVAAVDICVTETAHEGTAFTAAAVADGTAGSEHSRHRIRRSILDGLASPPGANSTDADWQAFAASLEARLRCREDDLCHTRRRLEEAQALASSEERRRVTAEQSQAASKGQLEHGDRKQLAYEQELSRLRRLVEHQRSLLSQQMCHSISDGTVEAAAAAASACPADESKGTSDPSTSSDAASAQPIAEQTVPAFCGRQPMVEAEAQTDSDCQSPSTSKLVADLEGEVTALTHGLRACESWREAAERQLAAEILSGRQAEQRLAQAEERLREIERQLAERDEASAAAEGRAAAARSALDATSADRDRLLSDCTRLKAERDAALRARAEVDGTRTLQKIREQDHMLARQELLIQQATERINFLTDELARRSAMTNKSEPAAQCGPSVGGELPTEAADASANVATLPSASISELSTDYHSVGEGIHQQLSPTEAAGDSANVATLPTSSISDLSTVSHSEERSPVAEASAYATSTTVLEASASDATACNRLQSSAASEPELLSLAASATEAGAAATDADACLVHGPSSVIACAVSDVALPQPPASAVEQQPVAQRHFEAPAEQQGAEAEQTGAEQQQQSELTATQCKAGFDSEPRTPNGQLAPPDRPDRGESESMATAHCEQSLQADERCPAFVAGATSASDECHASDARHCERAASVAEAVTFSEHEAAGLLQAESSAAVSPVLIRSRHVSTVPVEAMTEVSITTVPGWLQLQQQQRSESAEPASCQALQPQAATGGLCSLSCATGESTAAVSQFPRQLCDAATDPPSPLQLRIATSFVASTALSRPVSDECTEQLEQDEKPCHRCRAHLDVQNSPAVRQAQETRDNDSGHRIALTATVNEANESAPSVAPAADLTPELEALKMTLAEQESTMSQQDAVISRLEEDLAAARRVSDKSTADCRSLSTALEEARHHLAELQAAAAAAASVAAMRPTAECSRTAAKPVSTQTSPAADLSRSAKAKGRRSSKGSRRISSDQPLTDNGAESVSPCYRRRRQSKTADSKAASVHADMSGVSDAQSEEVPKRESEVKSMLAVGVQLKPAVVKLPRLLLQSPVDLVEDEVGSEYSLREERDVTPDVLRRKRQKLMAAASARKKSSRTSNAGSRKKRNLSMVGSPHAGDVNEVAGTSLETTATARTTTVRLPSSDATPSAGDSCRRPSRACKTNARSKIATIIEQSTSPLQAAMKSARNAVAKLTTPGSRFLADVTTNRKTPGGAAVDSPGASTSDSGTPESNSIFPKLVKAAVQGGGRKRHHLMSDATGLFESPEDELTAKKAKAKSRKPMNAHVLLRRALKSKTGVGFVDDDI